MTMEFEVQVFGMNGDQNAEWAEHIEYYDVVLTVRHVESGESEPLLEYDNMSCSKAAEVARWMERIFELPDAEWTPS